MKEKSGRIACLNKNGELIWEYLFKDSISTFEFTHSRNFLNNIIDTLTFKEEKTVLLFAHNTPLYADAFYKLNLRTGKRIDSTNTLWHAGGICSALTGDFDEDGKTELVAVAIHNGYERAVLFSINLDKLYGQSPAP